MIKIAEYSILKWNSLFRIVSGSFVRTTSTIDKSQLEHFKRLSAFWWNTEGPTKFLHAMNPIRSSFVRDGLIGTGMVNDDAINTKQPLTGLKIVDVGCGGGSLSEALAKLGGEVTGIDAVKELIAVAKDHASHDKTLPNLTYLTTTIEEFALDNFEAFDAIVASEVIEHVNQQSMFIKDCVKCVKPGGSVFITTINKTLVSKILAIWFFEDVTALIEKGTHEYEKFISPETVSKILEENNCVTKEVRGMWYNMFTSNFSWTKNYSSWYALHAVKKIPQNI